MLIQRCVNVVQRCFNAVQRSFDVVSTLGSDIVSSLSNVEKSTSDFVIFQRRINIISTLIHKVETTLIRRWNIGWVTCKRDNAKHPFTYFNFHIFFSS